MTNRDCDWSRGHVLQFDRNGYPTQIIRKIRSP